MGIILFARLYVLSLSMIVRSSLIGKALCFGFQRKNTTRHGLGPRRIRPAALALFSTESNDKIYAASYTKALIAGFVEAGPPVDVKEVMSLLEASILQHTLMPNVLRLKIPVVNRLNDSSKSAAVEISTTEQVATSEDATHYGNFSVCGDTHGQFYDVVNIFKEDIGGFPSKSNVYLFNGDFVDRGDYSVEVILTLLSIKLSDPTAMHLLRGNHESMTMTEMFGFRDELIRKYPKHWTVLRAKFQELFCSLPIAAVIENQGKVAESSVG